MVKTTTKSAQASIDMGWHLLVLFAVVAGASLLPETSSAATNAIEVMFCNLVNLLTGTTGKAIATIAVVAVGIGALLGKISWGMAMIVGIGVALVFGAATIVQALGSGAASCTGSAVISST